METSAGQRDGQTERRWRSVFAVAAWQAAASLCYYSVFAATEFVRSDFDVSRTLVGVFVTATLVGYTLNLFPSGAAVDGFGERPVMLVGLGALAVGVLAVSFAPSFGLLLVAGALLGAAYSPGMPATNRGIVTNAPRGRANFAMGLKQVGVTVGSGAASLVVTGVAAVAAWQVGFWVIAVVALAYAAVFWVTYEDSGGSGEWSLPDLGGLGADPAYVLLVAAGLFLGASIFTMLGYVVLYVVEVLQPSVAFDGRALAATAVGGLVLAGTQVTGSVGRVGAGLLADRLGGARGAATVALAQTALAAVLYAVLFAGVDSTPVAALVFVGLGLSILGSTGVFYSCMSAIVAPEEVGAATAGGQTAINVGGLLTPPLFGYLADTVGYGAGWGLLAGLMAAATVLFVGVRRLTRPA